MGLVKGLFPRLAQQENGEAYGSGLNGNGQLGVKPDQPYSSVHFPIKVAGVENAKDVCAGLSFACFVLGDERSVSCLGGGARGKLGRGSERDSHELAPALGLEEAVDKVFCSESAFALKAITNQVYAWGDNANSMLGNGPANLVLVPTALDLSSIFPETKVLHVGTGYSFNCFLTSSGKVFCAGCAYLGQLGSADHSDKDRPTPIAFADVETITFTSLACGKNDACASTSAGLVYCWGDNYQRYQSTPVAMPVIATASLVWVGWTTAFAVLKDGTAMTWGYDRYGQIGVGTSPEGRSDSPVTFGQDVADIVELRGGDDTACILNTAGEVWCMGDNIYGEMGLGEGAGGSHVFVPWCRSRLHRPIVGSGDRYSYGGPSLLLRRPIATPTSAPTPPADKACFPGNGVDKEGCAKLAKKCGKSKVTMFWAGAGCRVNGKLQHNGGCQCEGYCGYTCPKSCNLSSRGRCKWNDKLKVCTVAKTGNPYAVRDTKYCPKD